VFHCFEYQILGANAWRGQPDGWVEEGLASWAAWAVDPVLWGPSPQASPPLQHILNYVGDPRKQLFQRVYDAVGFWLHLSDVNGPLWSRIPAILKAGMKGGSSEAAFVASGADTDKFFNSWGSSILRAKPQDANWHMLCPCSDGISAGFLPSFADVKPGGYLELPGAGPVEAPPYGTSQYEIDGRLPVVHVAIPGHARLSVHDNYTDLGNAWFCTTGPGTCVCPAGTTGTIPRTQPLEPDAKLGLSGDPGTGTAGEVTSYPLSHFCTSPPTCPNGADAASRALRSLMPEASDQCVVSGSIVPALDNGDPYLTTFDDASYGFQQAGEFILAKSTSDDLEVQARMQPYSGKEIWTRNIATQTQAGPPHPVSAAECDTE
jgi:hypothetical protein